MRSLGAWSSVWLAQSAWTAATKPPKAEWLMDSRCFFLGILEAGSPRPTGQRGRAPGWTVVFSQYAGTCPTGGLYSCDLVTSHKCYLPVQSFWG